MRIKKVVIAVIPAVILLFGMIAASFFANDHLWEKLRQKDDFYVIFTDGEKEISTQKWSKEMEVPKPEIPEGKTFEGWVYDRNGEPVTFDPKTFTPPSKGENFIYLTPKFS